MKRSNPNDLPNVVVGNPEEAGFLKSGYTEYNPQGGNGDF